MIPIEIWVLIAEKLPVRDLMTLGVTAKHFRGILMPLLRGCKLFHMVVRQDESSSVQVLLNVPSVNIQVHDAQHMTVLHYAVLKGFIKLVYYITKAPRHKAILNVQEKQDGDTPIIIAARHGKKAIVHLLLDAGAYINAENVYTESALFWAVKNNRQDITRMLLNRGADPNLPVRHGLTPLIVAIMNGRLDLVTILIEGGCDVRQPDAKGYRPLSWAVIMDNLPIANLLLSYDTTCAIGTSGGADRSPLVWAIMKGHTEMVRLLLGYCPYDKQKQPKRCPPLLLAVSHRDIPVANLLLQNGAHPDEADDSGQTALRLARHLGDKAMMKLLSDYGADLTDLAINKLSTKDGQSRFNNQGARGTGVWERGFFRSIHDMGRETMVNRS